MRHRGIDLNLIVALQVVLDERNVTRSALVLNVTQSTMSGILARLREAFNDPLLVQVGRHMRLTPLAESLIEPSQQAMTRIDALLSTQPVFDPATARRKIVIATSDYVIASFLGDVLSAIAREAPGLCFDLIPPVSAWGGDVDAGRVDYVICPNHMASADHPQQVLFEDDYVVMAWSGNSAIGQSATTLELDLYQSLGHVIYRTSTGRSWFEQWYVTEHGDSRRIEMQVTGFNLIPALLVGTDRIATLQARLARRAADALPLRILSCPVLPPPLVEVLQWSGHQTDPVHTWLRSRLLSTEVDMSKAMAQAAE